MPWERYLVRLIHHHTRRAFPGSRLWTAPQLGRELIVKFLRARNRDGYDVYFQPEAFPYNAGYILVDLDQAAPTVLDAMCAHGHQPCVVVDTSPGHLQACVQVSAQPLPAAVAGAIGRQLARVSGRLPPIGVIWAGWQDSPIKNHGGACPADWLPG